MRKEFKAIIAAVLAVWLFMMGFEIGSYHEKQEIRQQQAAQPTVELTTLPPEETAAPTAEQPADTTAAASAPTTSANIGNILAPITTYPDSELPPETTQKATAPTTTKAEPTTQSVSSLSKAQILQRVTKSINALKSTPNMTARNEETISIRIVDCSAPSAINLINNFISKKIGDKSVTYVFVNGKAIGHDDSGKEIKGEGEVTPNQVIPPTDAAFTLPEAGVVSASASQKGGDITYKLKLAEETSTIDNPIPPYHSQAIGYLKMTDMQVPGATITGANMHYAGATLVVTTDTQGQVKQMQLHLPMNGDGTAKMGFLSGSASFEGVSTQNWSFSY